MKGGDNSQNAANGPIKEPQATSTGGDTKAATTGRTVCGETETNGPIKEPIKEPEATTDGTEATGSGGIDVGGDTTKASSNGGIDAVPDPAGFLLSKAEGPFNFYEVAKTFIASYYKLLRSGPEYMFRFHGEDTLFSHGYGPSVVGIKMIKARFAELDYTNCIVEIRSFDVLEAGSNTYNILVLGNMTIKLGHWRPFVHKLMLSLADPNTLKYYLKIDSLKFLF